MSKNLEETDRKLEQEIARAICRAIAANFDAGVRLNFDDLPAAKKKRALDRRERHNRQGFGRLRSMNIFQ
jgi:hypothetical protein